EVIEHLVRAEELGKVGVFGRKPKSCPRRGIAWMGTEERDAPIVRPQQARDHLDHARLPGAVWTQKTERLAGFDGERHAVDRPRIAAAVSLTQRADAHHLVHGSAEYTHRRVR